MRRVAALGLAALALVASACAASARPKKGAEVPAISTNALLPWLVGRWERAEGIEHWVPARDVMWGVGFTVKDGKTAFFEVLQVAKGEGGALEYVAFPGGANEVAFRRFDSGEKNVGFANPEHDFPKRIRYGIKKKTSELVAVVYADDPDQGEEFLFKLGAEGRAEELERADLAFAKDTAARGVDGWVAAFDPAGAMWGRRKKARIEGHDAIREAMAPLFAGGTKIDWQPIASGLSPAGDLGYTVGTSRFTDAAGNETHAGSYVTIWRRQLDGSWKVLFDTGN
jgi:ketosteroid isomerase-like protein